MNLALLLRMAAEGMGDRIAMGTCSMSYRDVLARATAAGAWIAQRNRENVAYCGVSSPVFPLALFSAAMAGRPFVPLNYRLTDTALRELAARTAPSVLIGDDDIAPRLGDIAGVEFVSHTTFCEVARGDGVHIESEALPDDIAILLFTSGTTAEPKVALLRHRHVISYILQTVEFMGAAEGETMLMSVPPYHIAAISSILTSVYAGRRIVQLATFQPARWIELAKTENVTHAMLVPTMLSRVVELLGETGDRLPALRHLSYGGGKMPISLIRRAMELMPHVDFVNAYGLTETSSTVSILDPQDHRNAFNATGSVARRRLGSVGRPLPGIEVRIRGADGALQMPNVVGEIWVRGDQVSGEYVGRRAVFDDGWMSTNDLGWLDRDGYLYIDGRLDDVIVRGGENISPGEVEEAIGAHPAVSDVAVVGAPDKDWGERIVAFVVVREPILETELKMFVREKLRSTKVPEEIYFRADLPYNDTGKLLRRELKKELQADKYNHTQEF
jgi:acyl-CoA synthetase (AMP-forming)/AMP-acid ligase II